MLIQIKVKAIVLIIGWITVLNNGNPKTSCFKWIRSKEKIQR